MSHLTSSLAIEEVKGQSFIEPELNLLVKSRHPSFNSSLIKEAAPAKEAVKVTGTISVSF